MTIELLMPALSPTMEKGTLAKWLVREGDLIRSGDLIAEIETDKATMEFEATEEGRVAALLISEGAEDVVVGTPIALIASEDDASAEVMEPNCTETVPEQHTLADSAPDASPVMIATERSFVEEPIPSSAVESAIDDGIRATPLARRIAGFSGIPLSAVRGSGPKGLIVKADLGLASCVAKSDPGESLSAAIAPSTGLAIPPIEGVPARSEKLSTMRKAIARRLSESKSTVPHFYLTARCNLDSLLALRAELNHALAVQNVKLSVNDMLIKALALALRRVPEANVQFGGDAIHHFERVDVSVAVAIEGGLVTPVIRDVVGKSVSAIAVESQALAAKAREGNLMPEDYAGGTVSLSNLGMFGIDEIVPVINPPQAVILGVGAGIRQPWEVNGEIALATIMAATASFDHRAIDGAAAARFMAALRDLVENPQLILL